MAVEMLVVGAGAVGAFYASRLAHAPDTKVSVICRSNYRAVTANGFRVTSPQYGSYTFQPSRTFGSPKEARADKTEWNYVVVSTKALPDVSDDSAILEGLVYDKSIIVLIQNGLGVEEPYKRRFPNTCILSAVTIVSAAQPENGQIKHNRWTRISIGPFLPHTTSGDNPRQFNMLNKFDTRARDDREAIKLNNRFVDLLQAGGIKDAEAYDHAKLQLVRWHKIAINASMNPSSVLSGGSANGAMVLDSELYIHLKGVMDEVLSTASKVLGVTLPADLAKPEQILKSTAKNTTGNKPSMQLDWEQGKHLELEVILGNPIRAARAKSIEMPRIQSLYALLKMAQANRAQQKQASKL